MVAILKDIWFRLPTRYKVLFELIAYAGMGILIIFYFSFALIIVTVLFFVIAIAGLFYPSK